MDAGRSGLLAAGHARAGHRRCPCRGPRRPGSRVVELVPAEDLATEPDDGVESTVHHALLHGDDRVIGDLDVLRADLGAALRNVAVPEPLLLLRHLLAVVPSVE